MRADIAGVEVSKPSILYSTNLAQEFKRLLIEKKKAGPFRIVMGRG
jgi:hypothetical protein